MSTATNVLESARRGDVEALQECLDNGADIDYSDAAEWTALIISADRGHVNCAKLLVSWNGKECSVAEENSWCSLCDQIARKANLELATRSAQRTALAWAASSGHSAVVKALLDAGE